MSTKAEAGTAIGLTVYHHVLQALREALLQDHLLGPYPLEVAVNDCCDDTEQPDQYSLLGTAEQGTL